MPSTDSYLLDIVRDDKKKTCLMKLLNQIIKTAASSDQSKQIYQDLFESGFERCLVVESTCYLPK
jgi:hypothetical protein